MPAPLAPPAPGGIAMIDPTPGPTDITSFEQAREAAPAPAPAPAPVESTPAPTREVQLRAPADPNRMDSYPDSQWAELESRATGANGEAKVKVEAPAPVVPPAPPSETATTTPPDEATLDAEFEKQLAPHTTLKAIRTAHKEALKREHKLKVEYETTQKRALELETRLKNGDVEQVKTLSTELENLRKLNSDYETRVKALDFTQSQEFHERFKQPVAKALTSAYEDLKEMTVTDERTGEQRAATEADFKALLSVPLGEATTKAKTLFGDLAGEVLGHRRGIVQLKRAEREALDNAGKLAEEHIQRTSTESTQRQQKLQQVYQQRRAQIEQKLPELFKAADGDAEATKVLVAGRQLAELLEDPSMNEEQRVALGTDIRMRAEAFGYLKLKLDREVKRNTELTEKLKSYEVSAPREGDGPAKNPSAPSSDPWDKAMKGLDKISKPM